MACPFMSMADQAEEEATLPSSSACPFASSASASASGGCPFASMPAAPSAPSPSPTAYPPDADDLASFPVSLADGSVLKRVLAKGTPGRVPPGPGDACYVHYRVWEVEGRELVEDTWGSNQPVEIRIDAGASTEDGAGSADTSTPPTSSPSPPSSTPAINPHPPHPRHLRGLALGVATMLPGEHALLRVKPEYAYGPAGNFSFPHVAPDAELVYLVQMLGFDPVDERKDRSAMTFEERVSAADARRHRGNQLFQANHLPAASEQYQIALSYLDDDLMIQLYGPHIDQANAVRVPCALNLAACHTKLGEYDQAVALCSMVLAGDGTNAKAMFRRGRARRLMGNSVGAREDIVEAARLQPKDAAVREELNLLRQEEAEARLEQKKMFTGVFAQEQRSVPAASSESAESSEQSGVVRRMFVNPLWRLLGWS